MGVTHDKLIGTELLHKHKIEDISDMDMTPFTGLAGKHLKVNDTEDGVDTGQKLRITDSPTFANVSISVGGKMIFDAP